MEHGSIEVIRSRNILGTLRKLNVEIDGAKVGVVGYNSRSTFQVGAGSHEVLVKMDWYKSNPVNVTVEAGQTVSLLASQSKEVLPIMLLLGALGAFLLRNKFGYSLTVESPST